MRNFFEITKQLYPHCENVRFFRGEYLGDDNRPFVFKDDCNYLPIGSVRMVPTIKELLGDRAKTFSLEHDHTHWPQVFGKENMLNPEPLVCKGSKIPWNGGELFVRPVQCAKIFKGGIYSQFSFHWPDAVCMVSPLLDIHQECRFFVFNGEIVTGSLYVFNGQLDLCSTFSSDFTKFAKEQVAKFPFPHFVLDVAKLRDGSLKVIEVNSISTSGFYHCDKYKLARSFIQLTQS